MNPDFQNVFASDNTSGICPEAWAGLQAANEGFMPSYGCDAITQRACEAFRRFFQAPCEVFFVFNGTAANALALASLCQSYHSVICAESAHVETDECGAPEFFSNGSKLMLARCQQGRLLPSELRRLSTHRRDLHFPPARVVSLSQSSELGTVYTPQSLREVCTEAHELGLKVHMDGARFFNALAALAVDPADITWRAGVDVLCCGGTKLGMAVTEAVVFFNPELAREFEYRCKQAGQLCSKMRFISAQWLSLLEDGAWRRHAEHGNAMARLLAAGLASLPGVSLANPVEANAVFARLPVALKDGLLARGWRFYDFIGGASRLMCSWATPKAAVDGFLTDAREIAAATGGGGV
jgi:threonine aldolase